MLIHKDDMSQLATEASQLKSNLPKIINNNYLTSVTQFIGKEEGRKEGNVLFNDALDTFYLRLYGIGHMVKGTQIVREETCCCHIGYSFQLTARVLLYASSHRQDNTYHSLCYASRGALA